MHANKLLQTVAYLPTLMRHVRSLLFAPFMRSVIGFSIEPHFCYSLSQKNNKKLNNTLNLPVYITSNVFISNCVSQIKINLQNMLARFVLINRAKSTKFIFHSQNNFLQEFDVSRRFILSIMELSRPCSLFRTFTSASLWTVAFMFRHSPNDDWWYYVVLMALILLQRRMTYTFLLPLLTLTYVAHGSDI